MYNPKKVLTEEGYATYLAHLHNIQAGLFFIENLRDDLHIGAKDIQQETDWITLYNKFHDLLPLLKKGDGERQTET